MTADSGEGHGVAEWAAGAKIGPQLGQRQRIRSYRWMLSICWMLSILSLFLLAIAVLEGGIAPVVHAASRRSTMYRSPLGYPLTKQQLASVINEGADRHIKTISVSDILDDPTNNEVGRSTSAPTITMCMRLTRAPARRSGISRRVSCSIVARAHSCACARRVDADATS